MGKALQHFGKWLLFSALKLFIWHNRQKHQLSLPFQQQNFIVIFYVKLKSITADKTGKTKFPVTP
jgi:hypothetical protein